MGFNNIEVIDADTIDLSNLNRQFLFRTQDIGKPKAIVAANFIMSRIPDCKVIPHYGKIQDFDARFYRRFHVVVCGLDSVVARRWINGMLASLVDYNDKGEVVPTSIIPMVDGGTEGFKGNARVIIFGQTPCIECTLDFYPPQVNYPLCTLANTPRLPEHCIEYVRIISWPKEWPFGGNVTIDTDNVSHIDWIHKQSEARATEYSIFGLTYRLTQGVIKHIIPAVASTNSVIAAACASEVFKIVTFLYDYLDNYMNFNDVDGVYSFAFAAERKEDCLACGNQIKTVNMKEADLLQTLVDHLKLSGEYQMRNPALTTVVDGANKTLYINLASCMEAVKKNLKLSFRDLGFVNGQLINVTDDTSPLSLIHI